MKKFKVILPIELPDGKIHQYGDIVELEEGMALQYAHALHAVESETKEGK